jgi:hypothetical protein
MGEEVTPLGNFPKKYVPDLLIGKIEKRKQNSKL